MHLHRLVAVRMSRRLRGSALPGLQLYPNFGNFDVHTELTVDDDYLNLIIRHAALFVMCGPL